jgi:hypothetical protein
LIYEIELNAMPLKAEIVGPSRLGTFTLAVADQPLELHCMETAEHSGADAAFAQAREDSSGIA